ncbi:LysR family transcriptional regulator [Paenibacillus sp. MWE-103]|uniref:LysR family transcriptional regulator n=1 Tax=Paenibacillus artemisiicola TaxID=1172618 RepID=A0ABS3W9R1_9BACL|nr:LysR family transcriptional regulator [Paenibacillus artemisiicola]MBO7744896.1 LysR family transcriptional regulator [Paenibacillus artemisiicola]
MSDINLEWYRSFYWCARTGSLSRAAERLHITQPAISHTLKQLEELLGGALFVRGPRGVRLTGEGEVLYRHVEQAFKVVEAGERKMRDMNQLAYGELEIGAGDSLCKHVLLPVLEQYHARYPQIRIRVTNRTTPETLALLKEGAIDLGIVHLPAEESGVDFTPFRLQQDCLVGGRRYAELAGDEPLKPLDLARYPLMMLEEGTSTRRHLDAYAESHGISLRPELELGSMDLLADFAKSGLGLAFVVRDYYARELANGELVELPLAAPIPARAAGIATRKGVPRSQAAKRLLALLQPEPGVT